MRIKNMRKIIGITTFILLSLGANTSFSANIKEIDRAELEAMLPPIRSFDCLKISDENRLYSKGMELMGSGDKNDLNSASDCLLMAAYKEHAKAQFELALMYYSGIGVPKSIAHAYKWATKSKLNENRDAEAFVTKLEKEISIEDLKYALGKIRETFTAYTELEKWQEAMMAKIEYDKIMTHSKDMLPYYSEYLTGTLNEIDSIYDGEDPILQEREENAAREDSMKDYYMKDLASQMSKRYQMVSSPYEKRKKLEEIKKREEINNSLEEGSDKKGKSSRRSKKRSQY
ncbi:MAG: Sel1 repeat protein [Alphaproteobacteria bacterium ADurb.Bin438]|nr:MAG: Sel1 repeat protein [Alphaproteobacteria bacterium ADurb.Bin438]